MKSIKTTRVGEKSRTINLPGVDSNTIEFDSDGFCELSDEAADAAVAASVSLEYANEDDTPPSESSEEEIVEEDDITDPEDEEDVLDEASDDLDQEEVVELTEEQKAEAKKIEDEAIALKEVENRAMLVKVSEGENGMEDLRKILIEGKVNGRLFFKTKDSQKLINLIIKEDIL